MGAGAYRWLWPPNSANHHANYNHYNCIYYNIHYYHHRANYHGNNKTNN